MSEQTKRTYRVIAIGVSTGGVTALLKLIGMLPADFALPVLIVQHISPEAGDGLARLLNEQSALHVKEADEGEKIRPGTAYIAPPNYHLLVNADGELSLSIDPPVSYARPSVDVLLESVASAFGKTAIGIILTGANHDGSHGLKCIHEAGGTCIVQDPDEAVAAEMPRAAIAATHVDHIVQLDEIVPLIKEMAASIHTDPAVEECS